MKKALFATLLSIVFASGCATTRQAPAAASAPLCEAKPGMLECLVQALAANKPAQVRAFCDEINGENADFDYVCALVSPVTFWMEDRKDATRSAWERQCRDTAPGNRADAVVYSALIYAKALGAQGKSMEETSAVLADATIAFGASCGVPREATGALLSAAGQEMVETGVEWPAVSCQNTPSCMAALRP